MDNTTLKNYAEFAIRKGLNLQKGQTLILSCPIETSHFARMCTEEAFKAGAKDVVVHYKDEIVSRQRLENASLETLTDIKPWVVGSRMDYVSGENTPKDACALVISAGDPEAYKGLDAEKITKSQQAMSKALKGWSDLSMANQFQWCVLSLPTAAWAKKVFPGESEEAAMEKLWNAIATATRMDTPDPVAAWGTIIEDARRRCKTLNDAKLTALHLKGENGTDLTVGLADDYVFTGGETLRSGDDLPFLANVPSEEIFTAPHKDKVDGIVKSSMPYVFNGNLIEGITIKFENGKATTATAEKGDDFLQQMMSADEGALHLGEIALVPASSPIRKAGVLFYNVLYDENAACHMALGAGYPESVIGGDAMSREQLLEKGLNDSLIHEDIMIGTPKMDIDGIMADGSTMPVFRGGEWVF